ncbi:Uncharacterised protein [Serratia odorifera]|jgi:hypothetical protein|uniref:Uncharacterized protein n=1 Tax=Serratia odorifera TaxID=618 RepID=A0A447KL13_SEROD|nr:Uncharacterised protein [Serratia odorifera]
MPSFPNFPNPGLDGDASILLLIQHPNCLLIIRLEAYRHGFGSNAPAYAWRFAGSEGCNRLSQRRFRLNPGGRRHTAAFLCATVTGFGAQLAMFGLMLGAFIAAFFTQFGA